MTGELIVLAAIGLEDLIPILVFGAIVAGIWFVLSLLSQRSGRTQERLKRLFRGGSSSDIDVEELEKKDRFQGVVETAKAFAAPLMPKSEAEQSTLKLKLSYAGFRSDSAAAIFIGLRTACLLVFLLVGFLLTVPSRGLNLKSIQVIFILGGIGFYLPAIILWFLRRRRQQAIFLTLPDALDLLVVCVESGLGLDAAMRKVCEEMKDHAKIICEELNLCNFQLQMGRPRREVLHDLGVRTGVDDLKSLAAILIQADRFGSSIAQALRVQSDSMRTRRKQIAEEKAAKTAVQLIFPLVLFIFPGIFIVLVGPAALQIMDKMMTK
jgi:tight adherence protein C